jgi:hypothetical protein
MDLATEADELALALVMRLATVDEVIDWADAAIIALDAPPYSLIEVACASRVPHDEVASLLRAIPGPRRQDLVLRGVLQRLAVSVQQGTVSPRAAAGRLYYIHLEGYDPNPDFTSAIIRLDDAFDLAADGCYGTVEDATKDLIAFLQPFLPEV